jgi:hypothetical protein
MSTDRRAFYTLKKLAEKGLACPGQLRRLDELAAIYEPQEKLDRVVDDFDRIGSDFKKRYAPRKPEVIERAKRIALAQFDRVGRSTR